MCTDRKQTDHDIMGPILENGYHDITMSGGRDFNKMSKKHQKLLPVEQRKTQLAQKSCDEAPEPESQAQNEHFTTFGSSPRAEG